MDNKYSGYTQSAAFSFLDDAWEIALAKEHFATSLLPLFPDDKASRILDVGCGYGKNLIALQEAGFTDLKGVDISPDQVEYARTEMHLSCVEEADGLAWLTGNTQPFDCILLVDILEHLSTDDLFRLAELLSKNLTPGGRVIVQVPNDFAPLNPAQAGDLTHQRAFTTQSLRQFFVSAGLGGGEFHKPKRIGGRFGKVVRRGLIDPLIDTFLKIVYHVLYGKPPTPLLFSSNIIGVARKSF